MTDQAAQADFDEEVEQDEAAQPEEKPGRTRRFAVAGSISILLLAGVGYGGAWSLGLLGNPESATEAPPEFYELPEMLVNLSSLDGRPQYLKIRASLEISDRRVAASIDPVLPRVLDAFQVYLRELRSTDLEGSAGLFRLKEELVRRVNMAIHPAEIEGVVFKEIIVQ
jgi:flagellar protein FliL